MAARAGARSVGAMSTLTQDLPVAERRVEAAGVFTAVLEGGDGPTVVLLHGPAGNATHWLRVIPELVATHRVVAPDLPGHGASMSNGDLDAVAWLHELIALTCAEPPVVVGYALGGAIAARFAMAHPDALTALVLVDALGLTDFEPAPDFGLALNEFLAEPTEDSHDELWRHCAFDLDALRTRMGERWAPFRAANVDGARNLSALGTLMAYAAPDDLSGLATPTTLIWGRHDKATPLEVAEAAGLRYGWPLHVIEDCADDPPIEQPAAFLRALRTALATHELGGEIVGRDHPRFDELRAVFNGMVDRRPAVIARCSDAADVSAAVRVAGRHGLPVSVYAGGHNVTGAAVRDDALMIDLRPMKGIEIEGRTCRAGAGLTWGELDAATQAQGLAVTGGRVSTTGVGGLAVGGGSGWIERKCGYTVDSLRSVEIVTADGRILTASEREHPDLFWAARGGGGNVGIVTTFEFTLHPIGPEVLAGMLLYPASRAGDVLRNFRDVMADAPDEVGAGVALFTADGAPMAGVLVCYAGPVEEGEEPLRALREFGPPVMDMVGPMPYVAVQQLIDEAYPHGRRNYWTGEFLTGLPDEAVETLCRFHLSKPSPGTQILVLPGGGAAARVPDGTMAISERGAPFNLHITSLWEDATHDEENIAWTRALGTAMKPFATGRVYVNFIGDEGEERVVASFGREGYRRLQAVKARYDPDNLFRPAQNVKPSV
jgi:FAD/FMN-containing dehydrogenase/pimeloyl-ACP methyl ester carboxylesterase